MAQGRYTKCGSLRDLVAFVQFKKHENTHGGVLILVKLQAESCNFTKINTPSWVFFTFFKLCKCFHKSSVSNIQNAIIKVVYQIFKALNNFNTKAKLLQNLNYKTEH